MYLENKKVLSVNGNVVEFEDGDKIELSETAQKYSITPEPQTASEYAQKVVDNVLPEVLEIIRNNMPDEKTETQNKTIELVIAKFLEHNTPYGLVDSILATAMNTIFQPIKEVLTITQTSFDKAQLKQMAELFNVGKRGNSPEEQLRNLRLSELKYITK